MGLELYDSESILDKINKSKRKKLMAFIKEHDGEETKIIPAGGSDSLPKNNRKDTGILAIILVGRNIYNTQYKDYWTLFDMIDKDGKETFTHYYRRQSTIIGLLDIQAPAVKVGRKKRVFTDEEKQHIAELHAQGVGIGRIARELKTSNRLIMGLLK